MVDATKYSEHIDRIQVMGARTIVSAHSPVIPEAYLPAAFEIVRDLPGDHAARRSRPVRARRGARRGRSLIRTGATPRNDAPPERRRGV